ncbi:hypothetical protein TWF788_006635 [Orbilia oligospora]|uniref:Uncharacterized protein n=1 Tax=Orbilia oligospora TaxID=2813651 RepID=A0A7C8PVG0_ORBOL|nr:hypothetical protein TWF788_006635 [Orbilia oligospora]KAF3215225.1 hypothetical protein TWF679_004467 [Orbilia oligospora]
MPKIRHINRRRLTPLNMAIGHYALDILHKFETYYESMYAVPKSSYFVPVLHDLIGVVHPWQIALVKSHNTFGLKNETNHWNGIGLQHCSDGEMASIGHHDLVSLRDGISVSYITVLQEELQENINNQEVLVDRADVQTMQRYPLSSLYSKPRFNSLFQIQYRDPLDIRKIFRFQSASGCYIASTFFHNKPPSDKQNNATALSFQSQRTDTATTAQEGAKADQFIDTDYFLEASSKDRIAETLQRTTLIGCTFEPKLEISTFKIVDEAAGVGRFSNNETSSSSPSLKLNWAIELLSAQVRMRQYLRLAIWAGGRGLQRIQTPLILGVAARGNYFRSPGGRIILRQTTLLARTFIVVLLGLVSVKMIRIQLKKRNLGCAERPKPPTTKDAYEGIVINEAPK